MNLVYFFILLIFMLLHPGFFMQQACAYLDPGTGSYFFQIIIGFLIGALFVIKTFWARITIFLKSIFLKKK